MLLLLLGSIGNLGGGTSASFTASTTNPAANFASGALVLANDVGSDDAAVCYSTGGSGTSYGDGTLGDTDDNDHDCDQLFPVAVNKPGDTVTVQLDVANVGNLDGNLSVFAEGACASADDPSVPYHGTGNLCNAVQLNIQRWTTDARNVAQSCIYGGGNATTCAFDTWGGGTPKTLTHFTTTYPVGSKISMGQLDDGAVAYLTISLKMDQSIGNEFQGLKASWAITWLLEQL